MKKQIFFSVMGLLLTPYVLAYMLTDANGGGKITKDIRRWLTVKHHEKYSNIQGLVYLLLRYKEFRNVFLMRLPCAWRIVCFYLPPRSDLHIQTASQYIGGGLYIGHGWGTVINAKRIGENCLVGQNVTIGSRNVKTAILEDNVHVWAHAVVLGDITIGHDSDIGAGAIVVKSVPPHSVVVPAKSCIIRQDGKKCRIEL